MMRRPRGVEGRYRRGEPAGAPSRLAAQPRTPAHGQRDGSAPAFAGPFAPRRAGGSSVSTLLTIEGMGGWGASPHPPRLFVELFQII